MTLVCPSIETCIQNEPILFVITHFVNCFDSVYFENMRGSNCFLVKVICIIDYLHQVLQPSIHFFLFQRTFCSKW